MAEMEKRRRFAQRKLEETNPRIEASHNEADYLAKQYQERLGDYLNQPDNARSLFDPAAAGGSDRGKAGLRAQLLEELSCVSSSAICWAHSGQLPAAEHLPRLLPAIHLQQLKKALVSREELKRVEEILNNFRRGNIPRSASRNFPKNPQNTARRSARRCSPLRGRLHAAARNQKF